MEKNKISAMKLVQVILGLMMIGSFVFFIFGETISPSENHFEETTLNIFQADWVQVKNDGTEVEVSVPGQCDAESGEWVTIKTVLPLEQADTHVCIRSMQQDMKIYVGDELREKYSTLDTQPFGKTSTMTYVFFMLKEADAGKELKIEFMSDSPYSGYVSEIYMGDKTDITQHFYGQYMPSAIVAALLLLIGMFVLAGSIFVQMRYKKKTDIKYLGMAMIIAASWLLVESRLRQFFFPNSTMAMLMGFFLIAILPYPILSYINSVQKKMYQKVYFIIAVCTAVNFVVVVTLQVFNIMDFFETMTSSHIIIIALILVMTVTIIIDIVKGRVREYREVAIGFAALMLAGLLEIGLTYIVSAEFNGIFLCVGLVMLLAAACLNAVRSLVNIEKEKQYAVAMSESKAKFLANMSHEIRTPINTIIGMNEMVLRENKDEAIEDYSYNIKSASQMLLGIINDILDFSKIEAGKLQIVESDYEIGGMLKDVILGTEPRAKQKGLELVLQVEDELPSVIKGDEIRIKQILNNLLSNAVKYTEKGKIIFSVKGIREEDGFSLQMSVKDTGIGIKKEDMEKLFASFQRLELSKNRYIEGTGLGLNITKLLVSLMNGTIEVESEYGEGSCFTVKLPQQIIDNTPMGSIEKKCKEHSQEKAVQDKKVAFPEATILVVDDTVMNLKVIKALLKHTPIQVDMADGGNKGFEMTRNKQYDLIFMDHMMPEPDGIQTFHMIREDESNINKKTPIIVLTANAIAGMKEQYIEEGFEDYLSKPVDPEELEQMLAKYLCK